MIIRYVEKGDIAEINKLLYQVHKIHADARPDLFVQNEKKYSDKELAEMIADKRHNPIFVAELHGEVVGYAFCQVIRNSVNSRKKNTIYIDDLCVEEKERGNHVGSKLFDYVTSYAKKEGFYNVTLNVWELNASAKLFYEKKGMTIQKYGMEKII